ncbi:MAG: hypothetical protein WBP22_02080 [Candidatus Saccharimonas sp.]
MELGTSVKSPNGRFSVELWIDGTPAAFHARCSHSRPYVVAERNQQYELHVTTLAGRIEVLMSVDGRNVFAPGIANLATDTGQLVSPGKAVPFDGWRENDGRASRLVFSKTAHSVAVQSGDADSSLGVIGLAAFSEQVQYSSRLISHSDSLHSFGGDVLRGVGTAVRGDSGVKSMSAPAHSPALGTGMGQSFESHVRRVTFNRSNSPADILAIGYDTAENLTRLGILTAPEPNPFPGTVQPPVGYDPADFKRV